MMRMALHYEPGLAAPRRQRAAGGRPSSARAPDVLRDRYTANTWNTVLLILIISTGRSLSTLHDSQNMSASLL